MLKSIVVGSGQWQDFVWLFFNNLEYHQTPIININSGYGGMKPSRTRTKEKLRGKFSLKYKQGKEKEKFDQTRFKMMNKKEKIKCCANY